MFELKTKTKIGAGQLAHAWILLLSTQIDYCGRCFLMRNQDVMSDRDHLNLTTLIDILVLVLYDRAKSDESEMLFSSADRVSHFL